MPQVSFGFSPSETIVEYDGKTLIGTNPIHDIATDAIIGRIQFTYTYDQIWDYSNERYLAKLDVVLLLDSLQDSKNIEANPLLFTTYYDAKDTPLRGPTGLRFKNLLTSVNNTISPNALAIISVNQDGYRIYQVEF